MYFNGDNFVKKKGRNSIGATCDWNAEGTAYLSHAQKRDRKEGGSLFIRGWQGNAQHGHHCKKKMRSGRM